MTMYYQTWGDVRPGDVVRHMSHTGTINGAASFGIKQVYNNHFDAERVLVVFNSGAMSERQKNSGRLLICRSVN